MWAAAPGGLDAALVRALAGGDGDGLAGLYDLYATRLVDYAACLLGDVRRAGALVHDVLIDAAQRAPRLSDHDQLRAWLYAALRRRLRQRHQRQQLWWDWTGQPPTPGGNGDPLVAAEFRTGAGTGAGEVQAMVEGALRHMDRADQEVLLLSVRHGLDAATLAITFGITRRQATRCATAARAHAVTALTAQQHDQTLRCAGHAAPSPHHRHGPDGVAIGEHVLGCPVCLRRRHLTVADLVIAGSVPPLPLGLRAWVLHTGTDTELAGYRADIAARGGPLTERGLPCQSDAPSPLAARARRSAAKAAATGAAMLAATLPATFAIGTALLPMLVFPPGPPTARAHHRHPTLAADPLAAHWPFGGATATIAPSGQPLPNVRPSPSSPPGGPHLPDPGNPPPAITPAPPLLPPPLPIPVPPLPIPPISIPPLPLPSLPIPPLPLPSVSVGVHPLPQVEVNLPVPHVRVTVSVRPGLSGLLPARGRGGP
ncbi:MAG: polymerase, sigma-24 subunit, subfamily [Actinomycetia bacterium]|nr:polymerase, sigma-24 subunit, subfamily [Actinomycetes bacterium]